MLENGFLDRRNGSLAGRMALFPEKMALFPKEMILLLLRNGSYCTEKMALSFKTSYQVQIQILRMQTLPGYSYKKACVTICETARLKRPPHRGENSLQGFFLYSTSRVSVGGQIAAGAAVVVAKWSCWYRGIRAGHNTIHTLCSAWDNMRACGNWLVVGGLDFTQFNLFEGLVKLCSTRKSNKSADFVRSCPILKEKTTKMSQIRQRKCRRQKICKNLNNSAESWRQQTHMELENQPSARWVRVE